LIRRTDEVIHSYEPELGENELLWQESDGNPHADTSDVSHSNTIVDRLGDLWKNCVTSFTVGATHYRNGFNGMTATEWTSRKSGR
jgi:hypothetical protein